MGPMIQFWTRERASTFPLRKYFEEYTLVKSMQESFLINELGRNSNTEIIRGRPEGHQAREER